MLFLLAETRKFILLVFFPYYFPQLCIPNIPLLSFFLALPNFPEDLSLENVTVFMSVHLNKLIYLLRSLNLIILDTPPSFHWIQDTAK